MRETKTVLGRPRLPPLRVRSSTLPAVKLRRAELRLVEIAADEAGLSLSRYVRRAVLTPLLGREPD